MKKQFIFFGLFMLAVLIGCTKDFEEINKNPNTPSSESVESVAPLVVRVMREGFCEDRFNTWRGNLIFGERFGEQFSFGFAGTWFSDAAGFNYHTDWTNAAWQVPYSRVVKTLNDVLALSGPEGRLADEGVYGSALVMKALLFQRITDQFGNVPYFEAGGAVSTPKYDSQEEIYTDLMAILGEAVTTLDSYLDAGNEVIVGLGDGDIAYSASTANWLKLANTLRLRIALRASDAANTSSVISECLAVGEFLESNDDIFQIDRDPSIADPVANGYYDIWWTFDACCGHAAKWVVSNTLVDYLKSVNDPRLFAYAMPVDGGTVGNPDDYLGGIVAGSTDTTNNVLFSSLSKPREEIWNDNTFPYISFTYAEAELLQAEAKFSSNHAEASAHYQAGIRASMEQWGVAEADIAAYLATDVLSADAATGAEQIGTQRWLAAYTNGYEAWSVMRRFDLSIYPDKSDLSIYADTRDGAKNVMPKRLQYGSDEVELNSANLEAGGTLPNLMSTNVWWDVDPVPAN